jgi:hypothetical protein
MRDAVAHGTSAHEGGCGQVALPIFPLLSTCCLTVVVDPLGFALPRMGLPGLRACGDLRLSHFPLRKSEQTDVL